MSLLPHKLENRFALLGLVLTFAVGGVIGLVGYRQMTAAVRHEAMARVDEATRVGLRLLQAELDRLDPMAPLPSDAQLTVVSIADAGPGTALYPLAQGALADTVAEGFALLPEGLSAVSVRRVPDGPGLQVASLPLRGAHRLPDQIRSLVFGSTDAGYHPATVTIFEADTRIATNVRLPDGSRATGTRVSDEVARRVLEEGEPWNDRAFVVDRWVVSSYLPIRAVDGPVIGMLYAGLDEHPYVAQQERSILLFVAFILGLTLIMSPGGWYLGKHLDASKRQVQEALDDYMEVLGFVAHELKSPIAGALSQMMMIDDGYVGEVPEKLQRPLAAIGRYLNYGHEIALSFNNLSRAESEGFAARTTLVADFAQEVISPSIADLTGQASQQDMSIDLQAAPVAVLADPDLMRVVVDNLIGNAVKYGRDGTEIRVVAEQRAQVLRVAVRNEGTGVPAERFPELFTKFHRINDPELRSRKGTGVGLYLVKKIVGLHGGQVGVDGQYGEWIEFWFEIPAGAGEPQR